MNSFWIPQLGGQMYAMTGMTSQLHLMATETGDFHGSAAEISGAGFSGMEFTVRSSSQADFDSWLASVRQSPNVLNSETYSTLIKPSENVLPNYYSGVESSLYDTIVMKYMMPTQPSNHQSTPEDNSTGSMDDMVM
jgi:cytochrome o ubiquinol oxidase subunit 2